MIIIYELRNLLSRRGLLLILLAAFALNFAMVIQGADTRNSDGYTPADLSNTYKQLPDDSDQILPWIEESLNSFAFSSYTEKLVYTEVYERVSNAVNYQKDLQDRLAEAELKLNSTFFAKPGTFDYRSLISLQKAYTGLAEKNIQPTAESSLGIELATETRLTDAVLAFIALTLAFGFIILPKEDGLFALLKPMKNGRGKLLAAKFGALLCLLFFATVLIYCVNLLIGHTLFGLGSLSRPVQSLYGFSACRYAISVWQYLILFILHKFLWAASLGCLFLCVCVFIRSSIGVCFATITLLLANILCFQSAEPWIRMTSLIWVSDTRWYFSGYYNLSFFSYPADAFFIALTLLCIVSAAAYALSHIRFEREENVIAEKSSRKKRRVFRMHTNLLLHEGYKLFIRQQGALILFVFLALQAYVCYTQYYYTDSYDHYYAQELAGFPSAAQENFIASENARFDNINAQLEQYFQQLINGNISEETFQLITRDLKTQLLAEPAFRRAESQYAQIKELADANCNAAYVELQVYEHILGEGAKRDNAANAAKLAVVIAFGLSALFAVEHSTYMDQLLAISPLRRRANMYKIFWAGLFSIFAALIAFIPKIVSVDISLGYTYLNSSIRSLLLFPAFFSNFSILGYIISIGAVWILSSCVGATAALLISDRTKSRAVSALASCLPLLAPALLLG